MMDVRLILLIGVPAILAVVNGIECVTNFMNKKIWFGIGDLATTVLCIAIVLFFFSLLNWS